MRSLIDWVVEGAGRADTQKTAIRSAQDELSYGELIQGAQSIAAELGDAGIGAGDRVGVWMSKTPACVQVLLGVMWAGAAYVPLDPRAPWVRSRKILLDCGLTGLVVDAARLEHLESMLEGHRLKRLLVDSGEDAVREKYPSNAGTPWASLEAVLSAQREVQPKPALDDLAYILYTSGSTGIPKGVVHTHRSGLAFARWIRDTFSTGQSDVFSSHAPIHFDLSISDLYSSLGSGACLHLISSTEGMLAPYLVKKVPEWGITVWYSVPSILVSMLNVGNLEEHGFGSVRTLFFAGEVFPTPQLRRLRRALPGVRMANLFGPTETNVCTYYVVPDELPDDMNEPISIGRGCEHMETFAIKDDGTEAGVGEVGILWARGDNLMQGYWNDPEKTASMLQADPRGVSGLACCTGDRVELLEDGNYKFLGRRDHMVKIRGYRVDLGEVESALAAHPDVLEAVSLPLSDDGETWLAASVVLASGGKAESKAIRGFCAERLPSYMVPKEVEIRESLPMTSTGKADRQLLSKEWKEKVRKCP